MSVPAPQIAARRALTARVPRPTAGLVAVLIIVAAAALRLMRLGLPGFTPAELFHVFAAKSWLTNGTMDVPLWGAYETARPVTLIVAAAFRFLGESEGAARVPLALASVGFLVLFYSVVRRLFSTGIALSALFITSLAPLAVIGAREARLFSLHETFYFAAAVSFLIGFEDLWRTPGGANLRGYRMDVRWLGAAALFGAAAWVLHPLTVTLGVAVAVYFAAMFAAVWLRVGFRRAAISKYALGLFAVAAAGLFLAQWRPGLLTSLWRETSILYGWQAQLPHDRAFYRYLLTDQYPALLFLYPVGLYASVRYHGRRGVFFAAVFLPALIALTLVERKSDRYFLHLLPFLAVTASAAVAPAATALKQAFLVHFGARPARNKVVAIALFSPLLLVLAHPWLETAARVPFQRRDPDWKTVDPTFRSSVAAGTIVTTNPREVLYYFRKYPAYFRVVEQRPAATEERGFIADVDDLHRAVTRGRDVYFLAADWNFVNEAFLTGDMRSTVLFNMAAVDHGGDRRILAYHRD